MEDPTDLDDEPVETNPIMSLKTWFLLLMSVVLLMMVGQGSQVVMRASMMGVCPTGGQANNILRYENFDTGGDVFDQVLDEKHGVGVQDPPDLEGDVVNISDLQATRVSVHDEICRQGGDEPYVQVLAVEGGDADRVLHGGGVAVAHNKHGGEADFPGELAQGDALHGHGGVVKRVHVPVLARLCSEGGNEPHSQAPADVGGDPDEVPPDDQGAAQYKLHTQAPC